MIRKAPKRIYAALLLLILVAAYAGHKVHIYKEDPAHFAALCGDLMPDNGAHQIVVERCIVDDFYFFPYLDAVQPAHSFYCGMLGVLMPEPRSADAACRFRAFRCARLPRRNPQSPSHPVFCRAVRSGGLRMSFKQSDKQ